MAVLIRLAAPGDADAIAAVYRPYVEGSRVSFEEAAPDAAELARRIASPLHPWLVIELDGEVVGYASTGPLRGRPAYRWSVETGLYLRPNVQGRGLGGQLLDAHLGLLEQRGFVTAIAGISLPNPVSVALHERRGFTPIGVERGVGFKLGQWVDVSRWQRDLAPRAALPVEPLPVASVRASE